MSNFRFEFDLRATGGHCGAIEINDYTASEAAALVEVICNLPSMFYSDGLIAFVQALCDYAELENARARGKLFQ